MVKVQSPAFERMKAMSSNEAFPACGIFAASLGDASWNYAWAGSDLHKRFKPHDPVSFYYDQLGLAVFGNSQKLDPYHWNDFEEQNMGNLNIQLKIKHLTEFSNIIQHHELSKYMNPHLANEVISSYLYND